MSIFFNLQKANVYYDIKNEDSIFVPKGFFNNIEQYTLIDNPKCPAVSSVNNRLFYINSPLDLQIEINYDKNINNVTYNFKYENAPNNIDLITYLKNVIAVNCKNNIVDLQFLLPYNLYTDIKNTEVITLPPDIETKNLQYVPGAFNINLWIRPINSAWLLIDKNKPGIVNYKKNKPMMYLLFNKNININYKEFNIETLNYYNQIKNITSFVKNINNISKNIVKRKPKKFML